MRILDAITEPEKALKLDVPFPLYMRSVCAAYTGGSGAENHDQFADSFLHTERRRQRRIE
jgi:hypothetical protein